MFRVKFRNSKNLLKVLSTAENILKKNKAENVLKFIKLENIGNQLNIIAKNPYMKLHYIIEDTLEIEGTCIYYDYKTFISLLNVLDNEIEINNDAIKNFKCKYKIPYSNVEGYPDEIIPQLTNAKPVDTQLFKECLEGVICATQKTEYQSALSGVYIDKNKVIGCDGNRIFIKELDNELDNIILSAEMVNEILKLPFKEKMFMSVFGQNVIFSDENIGIACNFISADYPKYESILPKEINNEVYFENKDLLNALNLIMPVINQNTNKCNFEIRQDDMVVYTENEAKKAETLIPVSLKEELNKPIKVMFNINYLLDMLKVNNEAIRMQIHNTNTGYSFKSENSYQYIMPMTN